MTTLINTLNKQAKLLDPVAQQKRIDELVAALRELVERAEAEGNIDGLPEYDQARAALAKADNKGE